MGVEGAGQKRTLRRLVSVLVVLGLVALVVTTYVAVTYQPLAQGSSFGANPTDGSIQQASDARNQDVEVVPYHDGEVFSFTFGVRNSGSWGVTVNGVGPAHIYPVTMLQPVQVLVGKQYDGHPADYGYDGDPFKPFVLGAKSERNLTVRVRIAGCEYNGAGVNQRYGSVRIRYSFMGFDHEVEVPMSRALVIYAPTPGSCPRVNPTPRSPNPSPA
jgi:hypothetical protein